MSKDARGQEKTLRDLSKEAEKLIPQTQSAIDRAKEAIRLNDEFLRHIRAERLNRRDILGLTVGMTVEQVQALLCVWEAQPRTLNLPEQFKQWDFLPPKESACDALRLTFDGDRLLVWGTPASQ